MIDADRLRSLLAATVHQPPWCVYPPGDPWGAGIGAATTKYTIGSFEDAEDDALAVAAVNALPGLLAVYEAACAWRADRTRIGGLISALDAAGSAP